MSFAVPLGQYPAVLKAVETPPAMTPGDYVEDPYHIFGRMLSSMTPCSYAEYVIRVSDVEGARRALLLMAAMRSQSILLDKAENFVEQASQHDPYTGAAFEWDEVAEALIFTGLEPTERARHSFVY